MNAANQNLTESKTPALEAIASSELETIEGGINGTSCLPGLNLPIGPQPGPIPGFRDVFARYTIGRNLPS
jgi:hypothetical protein